MSEELTTGAAFAAMEAGEELEWSSAPSCRYWRHRMLDGQLQCQDSEGWVEDATTYTEFAKGKWRRVPKTPRVHELAEEWRGVTGGGWSLRLKMIEQLEAALEADEVASLKGVTAMELFDVWCENSNSVNGFDDVIAHLRKRGTP